MRTVTATAENRLSLTEKAELRRLKEVVARGEKTFVEVGVALLEIRERKLYREESENFEEFCRKNWGWGASRARQICAATKYFQECEEAGIEPPRTERQARAAMSRKSVTTGNAPEGEEPVIDIEAERPCVVARTDVMASPLPDMPRVVLPRVSGTDPVEVIKDHTGHIIPRLLVPLWKRNQEVDWMLECLKRMQGLIEKSTDARDHMYASFNHSRGEEYFSNLAQSLKACAAYAVCPYCQGHPENQPNHQCSFCHGKGLVSEFQWRVQVPDNIKDLRTAQVKGAKK